MKERVYFGECVVTRDAAKRLAQPFGRFNDQGVFDLEKTPAGDPFAEEIAASLLSAADIRRYVERTGLIAPFYVGRGEKSLLKDASYEGRIGDKALWFRPGDDQPSRILSKSDTLLRVPANSIVFVECDLDFRLPEFIALRFNLQIKHVHRGLLLGTGPLIDPGYWGKLCIPLHNLTDEPYSIDRDDGLIWIEFTRTTDPSSSGDTGIGRPPLGKEYWDIEDFIEKASRAGDGIGRIAIRSSIPGVVQQAEQAVSEAKQAAEGASAVTTTANELRDFVYRRLNLYGWVGFVAVFIGLGGLLFSLYSVTQAYYSDLSARMLANASRSEEAQATADELAAAVSLLVQAVEAADVRLSELEARIEDLSGGPTPPGDTPERP